MEEKVLIKSERYNIKRSLKIILIIAIIWLLLMATYAFLHQISRYNSNEWLREYALEEYGCPNAFSYAINHLWINDFFVILWIIPPFGLLLIEIILYLWLKSYELTVTDKRIYGKVAWGKRVDLPVDSVSAISTNQLLRGVSVSTASGKVGFLVLKNAEDIYKVINDIIIKRQHPKSQAVMIDNIYNSDEADKLKKFKELLDSGVITQDEFDAKKKQLLGL